MSVTDLLVTIGIDGVIERVMSTCRAGKAIANVAKALVAASLSLSLGW